MVPLCSERGEISVEVMAVHNLPVGILPNAVQIVPNSDAVVNAGCHQLTTCLGTEVCTVDQPWMVKARKLTCTCNAFACTCNILEYAQTTQTLYMKCRLISFCSTMVCLAIKRPACLDAAHLMARHRSCGCWANAANTHTQTGRQALTLVYV